MSGVRQILVALNAKLEEFSGVPIAVLYGKAVNALPLTVRSQSSPVFRSTLKLVTE